MATVVFTAEAEKQAERLPEVIIQRVVIMEENEYVRLRRQADDWEPPLPEPDSRGNYPAWETLAVILARKIMRHRRRAGFTQVELARRAGIRPERLTASNRAATLPAWRPWPSSTGRCGDRKRSRNGASGSSSK